MEWHQIFPVVDRSVAVKEKRDFSMKGSRWWWSWRIFAAGIAMAPQIDGEVSIDRQVRASIGCSLQWQYYSFGADGNTPQKIRYASNSVQMLNP